MRKKSPRKRTPRPGRLVPKISTSSKRFLSGRDKARTRRSLEADARRRVEEEAERG